MFKQPSNNLIRQAQQGDHQALAELTATVRPRVEQQLRRYPVSEEDRKDLLQSTLMQVVRNLASYRGDSAFSTWLFRVTANEALMLMRSQRRRDARLVPEFNDERWQEIQDPSATHNVMQEAMLAELQNQVHQAVQMLPDTYRMLIEAHYHRGQGLQDIADLFGISESAVRSKMHRARRRLRASLTEASAADAQAIA